MKSKIILAAAFLAAATAFPAAAEEATKPYVCLRHNDFDGWGSRDNHSMVANDRFGRKYLISLSGLCSDLNWSFGVGFRGPGHFSVPGTCIERGDHVVMRGGGAERGAGDTCWVTKVQLYTKDMEMADKMAREQKQPLATY